MQRDKAIEAVRLLNDLWWDILAGDGLFQVFEEHRIRFRSEEHLGSVQRMVFFHLAMVLCKLAEFYRHYSRHLPEECRMWLKGLSAEVERRGLRDLRNKAIGHVLDKDAGTPLTGERLDQLFRLAVDDDSEQFYRWMRNAASPGDLDTVMGRVKWLMDEIMRAHALSASDVGLKSSTRC
jgi:hypothetical protein